MIQSNPHDSAYVYSSKKNRHWYKVAPSLREKDKSRGQWLLLGLMVIFAVVGGSFLGFILETQVINPPYQVVGLCPPPAFVSGYDCLIKVTTVDAQGNSHIIVQQSGTIVGANGTSLQCVGKTCIPVG